ncbi:MAG TPA: hypothetical protein VL295_00265 [Gemmatimonadales bacterium]|nr:hypothetical protein [Gemmatimonadales bacterium]
MAPLLALALLAQAPTHPDTLQVRKGLYAGFGLGPAVVGFRGAGAQKSLHLMGQIGVAVSPHLTVGVQHDSWGSQQNEDALTNTTLALTWYPDAGAGAFVRPNLGLASFHGVQNADGPTETGSGFAGGITVGQDLRFDKKLSLTPTLTMQYANIGTTYMVGFPRRRDISSWMVGVTVGLTWH